MEEYLVKIIKGAWNLAPCEFIVFTFNDKLYVRQLSGRAPLPEEVLTVLSRNEKLSKLRGIASVSAMPVLETHNTGTSGCIDILLTNAITRETFNTHVSMYQKLNYGMEIPYWGITAIFKVFEYMYGYSNVVEFRVEDCRIIDYITEFPCTSEEIKINIENEEDEI